MLISTEILTDILYGDKEGLIEEELVETSRWTSTHTMVFEYEGRYYSTHFERGLTEYQDVDLFDEDERECQEVEQVEVTVKIWRVIEHG